MSDKIFKAYYVWPRFPSLSMSGSGCSLMCRHCDHKYLSCMRPVTTSSELVKVALELEKNGAVGFLLSGGCAKDGTMLNLPNLIEGIKNVKQQTDLIVKLHTGFLSREMAERIVDAGVDIGSMEMVGDAQTIKEIFNLDAEPEDYQQTFKNLTDAGMRHIVPHICAGLHYGGLRGEFRALEMIKEACNPSTIVFIVLRPTPGTELEYLRTPEPEIVATVVRKARQIFPDVELSLGCMRPRSNGRDDIELAAFRAGATRMEIPSRRTIEEARGMGYEIRKIDACCALPAELENRAINTAITL